VFGALCGLSVALRDQQGVDVRVFGLIDDATADDMAKWRGLPVHTSRVVGPRAFGYAADLHKAVCEAKLDVLHIAGTWMYPTLVSLKWGRETGSPVVVSPHGNLDPWALSNSRWKKKMAMALFEMQHLRRAACLHALHQAEADSFRTLGLTNPICVIPNGVDLPHAEDDQDKQPAWAGRVPPNAKILFFLGRLHPKKNIGALLDAWNLACHQDARASGWWLVIAGWNQNGHEEVLRHHVACQQVPNVLFIGPQYDDDKDACFRSATAFILPSLSEGLPMAVLEAWSYGLPSLITPECNLPEGIQNGAAIETAATTAGIERALRVLLTTAPEDLKRMGLAGRRLVECRFTWNQVAKEVMSVYRWLANGGGAPRSIQCNS
jgi:poly(glycerol-phosphate) alpha-glucosyltransferase